MKGREIVAAVAAARRADHCCVRSWKENRTFVDYEIVDRFLESVTEETAIEGFDLLDLEGLWQALVELDPDSLTRVRQGKDEVIEWEWSDTNGNDRVTTFPFSPQGIMTIMNEELFA